MKRIIVCIVIAVISLITAVTSFAINDYHRYRSWMRAGNSQMMRPFGGKDWEDHHREMMGDFRNGPRDERRDDKDRFEDRKDRKAEKEERNRDKSPASNFGADKPAQEKSSAQKPAEDASNL